MKTLRNTQQCKLQKNRHVLVGGLSFAMLLTSAPAAFAGGSTHALVQSSSESRQVSGTVIDETGLPMIGVSIVVKGTKTGTVTDMDGRFNINATADEVLELSYIGYQNLNVAAKNKILSLKMVPDTKNLEEVVVIGYGTVKKRDVTGSVSSVKTEEIMAVPTTNVVESLQGRIAGLDITQSGGEDVIRIRGNRSVNGSNEPLFIIDGVQGGSYSDLNPADIESIDVLKDASSTAIYGSQGANGVIIITTRKADKGKMAVTYNGYAGISMREEHPDYRQGQNYYEARRTAASNAGQWKSGDDDQALFSTPEAYAAYQRNEWTNYEDLLQSNAITHNHQLTVSGGNDKTSARFSLGYSSRDDYWNEGSRDRYTMRANIDQHVFSWLSSGINFQLTYYDRTRSPYESVSTNGVELGLPYNEKGELVTYPVGETGYVNPLLNGVSENVKRNDTYGANIVANGYIDIKPVKGVTFRSQVSTNLSTRTVGEYTDNNEASQINSTQTATASMTKTNNRFIEWNNILTYTRKIGDHTFGATGITAWTKKITDTMVGTSYNQLVDKNLWWNLGSGTDPKISSSYVQQQTSSYAARINYDYKGKYLLTASMRWDGASVLAPGNKWASFPSAAFAWRMSDERFMENTSTWLDDLKVRVSYGITGNSGINPYGTQSGVSSSSSGLGFGDTSVNHYYYNSIIGNKDTKWEMSATTDVGFDMSVLNGRISFVFDYYNTKTTDMMLLRTLPTSAGNDGKYTIYQNIGATKNAGFEFSLNTVNIKKKSFSWNTTLTFSKNDEKITQLIDGNNISLTTEKEKSTLMIGRPIKSFRTFTYQGIYTSKDAALAAMMFKDADKTKPFAVGDIRVKDLDGDGVIDQDNDIDYVGSESPDWFAGFNNSVRYKDFDFSVYCFLRWGHWGDNPARNYDPSSGGKYASYDFFQPETNEGGNLPMLYSGRKLYDYIGYQSLWYCDQSFFKVKTITLGYTVPKQISQKARMERARVYATVTNPFYASKSEWMKGYDPEGSTRNYVIGVNVSF